MARSDLPPWKARNETDRLEMIAWVNERLDAEGFEELEAELIKNQAEATKMTTHDYAVAMALSGPVEMLRSLYPEFAVCIQPPKCGRGRPRGPPANQPFRETRIAIAIEDVRRIRTIGNVNTATKTVAASTARLRKNCSRACRVPWRSLTRCRRDQSRRKNAGMSSSPAGTWSRLTTAKISSPRASRLRALTAKAR